LVAEISVDVLSDQENRLMQLFSHNTGHSFPIPAGRSAFCVELQQLPLAPGRYNLVVWIGSGQITFDLVWNCYSMVVDPGYYEKGYFIENRGFSIVPKCVWTRQK